MLKQKQCSCTVLVYVKAETMVYVKAETMFYVKAETMFMYSISLC